MNDRKILRFQVVLLFLLMSSANGADPADTEDFEDGQGIDVDVIMPSDAGTEEDTSVRFGDPESDWKDPDVAETPIPSPTPTPQRQVVLPKTGNTAESIRKIIEAVPPGAAYPEELDQLIAFGPKAVPTLREIFSDASAPWQSRWITAMALGRIGGKESKQVLEKGLNDPLFLIRMASVQALGRMGDLSSAPLIREVLSDKALVVRSSVAKALGELRDTRSVPALIKELSSKKNYHRGKSLWVREDIVVALSEIGDQKAVPVLIDILKEDEKTMRDRACEALARILPAAPPSSAPAEEDCAKNWLAWHASTAIP